MNINAHKTTKGLFWWEDVWKIQLHNFLTAIQQDQYDDRITSKCWRNCGDNNDCLSHGLWSSPRLKSFWEDKHDQIQTVWTVNFTLEDFYLTFFFLSLSQLKTVRLNLYRMFVSSSSLTWYDLYHTMIWPWSTNNKVWAEIKYVN